MTTIEITGATFEETSERLKIVLPLKRQVVYLAIYSVLLIVWLGMFAYGIFFMATIAFSGERFAFAFTAILLLFLFVLYRLGKMMWRQWQFYVASREILFLYEGHMIIRRPVSFLGITTGYDRQYIRPFYYDDEQHSPAFAYGSQYVLLGRSLDRREAETLVQFLNGRYFPDYEPYDDE